VHACARSCTHYKDFHGAYVSDLSVVHDWINKDEDFRHQNLIKEKIAQVEDDDSCEEMRKMRRKKKHV
jgi:hypothetical protein